MTRYRRRRGVKTRWVDDCAFLITHHRIDYLNPPAALVWKTMRRPAPRSEINAALKSAWPTVPYQRRAADLTRLLADLRRLGLISSE